MCSKINPSSEENQNFNKLTNLVTFEQQSNEAVKVSYPLSFLLLESEEDSFVKGYN
jgi:hypothetical protein